MVSSQAPPITIAQYVLGEFWPMRLDHEAGCRKNMQPAMGSSKGGVVMAGSALSQNFCLTMELLWGTLTFSFKAVDIV